MAWSLRVPPGSEERLPLTPALGVLGEETEVPSGPARGLSEAETYWLAAGGQTRTAGLTCRSFCSQRGGCPGRTAGLALRWPRPAAVCWGRSRDSPWRPAPNGAVPGAEAKLGPR